MVERGENGQLKKGSVLNPAGRPKKAREERYLEILLTTVTFDDWKKIVERAVDQAKRGDATARKWLADYAIGAPVQKQEVSGADGAPLEIIVRYADNPHPTEAA